MTSLQRWGYHLHTLDSHTLNIDLFYVFGCVFQVCDSSVGVREEEYKSLLDGSNLLDDAMMPRHVQVRVYLIATC